MGRAHAQIKARLFAEDMQGRDRGMTAQIHLTGWGEPAQLQIRFSNSGLGDKRCFRAVHFLGNPLHLLRIKAIGIRNHNSGVAAEGRLGKCVHPIGFIGFSRENHGSLDNLNLQNLSCHCLTFLYVPYRHLGG